MPYDLLLKGGEVIDPGWPFHQQADVAISKGKIAAVAPDIPTTAAARVLDVSGKIVCPGLIDLHAHVFTLGCATMWQSAARCGCAALSIFPPWGSFTCR